MRVDAIVGLQYGSEGKGAVVARMAGGYDGAVRTGAPNAGHTVLHDGVAYKMRSVPCNWVNPRCRLFVGAGGLLNLDVLAEELKTLPRSVMDRLKIDRNCGIIDQADIEEEEHKGMNKAIGSTAEGVGPAQARKVLRRGFTTAGQVVELAKYITDVAGEVNSMIDEGQAIMLEGTQGFGLSMNHGPYPFTTSRDVLASSLFSDAGLAPGSCRSVYGVMRTYPIRVAGNSGPMGAEELSWEEITKRCGAPEGAIVERTTVTKRIRRVSEIDWELLKRSVACNRPNGIFITFIDYLGWEMHGKTSPDDLNAKAHEFIKQVESRLGVPVIAVGTGAGPLDQIWLRPIESIMPEKKA